MRDHLSSRVNQHAQARARRTTQTTYNSAWYELLYKIGITMDATYNDPYAHLEQQQRPQNVALWGTRMHPGERQHRGAPEKSPGYKVEGQK